MTQAETVGLIASVLAIFQSGYFFGRWRAIRQRISTLDEAVAARIRNVLGAVEIKGLACDTKEVFAGQTVGISFNIVSKAEFPYQVWVGASIVGDNGVEYFDVSEDKEITLEPGQSSHSRYLTVSGNARGGTYTLYGAIWLGTRAMPANSIRLARLHAGSTLRVKEKLR